MSMVEITIGNSRHQISCNQDEKEKLLALAKKLNKRVNQLSFSLKDVDEKTLLVIAALMAEEELERKSINEEEREEAPEEVAPITGQDLFEAISEVMDNMTDHIEKLSKKVREM